MVYGGVCSNPPYVGKNPNSFLVSYSLEEPINTVSEKGLTRVVSKAPEDRSMVWNSVKTPLTIYVNKPTIISDSVSINSIRCQNVTIRRKNRKKELREKIVDEGEKKLLLEAGYIPVSDRIRMVEEGGSSVNEKCRALRAQNPSSEVLE